MFININDIKNGMTIIMDGNLCTIQEFQHVKPGKGPAFVRIKLKNLNTSEFTDENWNINEESLNKLLKMADILDGTKKEK